MQTHNLKHNHLNPSGSVQTKDEVLAEIIMSNRNNINLTQLTHAYILFEFTNENKVQGHKDTVHSTGSFESPFCTVKIQDSL